MDNSEYLPMFLAEAREHLQELNLAVVKIEEVRDALHARLADSLRPGGVLLIGSTERVSRPQDAGLKPTHPFVYRKVA